MFRETSVQNVGTMIRMSLIQLILKRLLPLQTRQRPLPLLKMDDLPYLNRNLLLSVLPTSLQWLILRDRMAMPALIERVHLIDSRKQPKE